MTMVLVLLLLHKFIQMVQLHFNAHHLLWNVLILSMSNYIGTNSAHSGEEYCIPNPYPQQGYSDQTGDRKSNV